MTLSRLVKWKRVGRAIDAINKLKIDGYSCKLLIIGDGPEKTELEKLVRKYSIEEHVKFIGSINHELVYT